MKEAVIASAVAAGLVLLLGLEGCSGQGVTLWKTPVVRPTASPAAKASREQLTDSDRLLLTNLINKYGR